MTDVKMSDIRNRTVLCIANLPKKLTSQRNLHAHFSKFGEVEDMVVKKELRSGIIKFTNHFGAQAAKVQGKEFEGKSLNIFWSDYTSLDPRSKNTKELKMDENNELWEDDYKECFGVEPPSTKATKPSAVSMIKQHLKLPPVKKRLVARAVENKNEFPGTTKLFSKSAKTAPKTLVSLKKSLMTHGNTHKLERKGKFARSDSKKLKQDLPLKSASSLIDMTNLKYKLKMLDDRDKIIRQGTVQNPNIKTAVAIKGTCPDMCPERERILRQVGHSIATYEMIEGTNDMDENKALKEYIRSSADQEVPLPHDLRPEPVLSLTMNYLITQIIPKVDNCDENKAVWYSFCWNRLRSIRKDIIVQQLCDIETVTIVEQCARFHISCYDHMWGAEVSGFDDKINTQNLIDCLQTLKHMYEDLAKHNITCPNESEFYSYLILLKLMTGDVMWEYQHYSIEMQLSPHVQFAIQTYMEFKNNMYSKYFNLVKRASYLTACLMQRYFEQVRIQALKTMSRAYSLPGRTVGLSSSFLVDCLKFDSHTNATQFCEKEEIDVRVDCDTSDQTDYVTSSSFLIKEKRLPIANAVVGESNPLPKHIVHHVSSSFDSSGLMKDSFSVDLDKESHSEKEVDSFYSYGEDDSLNTLEYKKLSENEFHEPGAEEPSFKFLLSPNVKSTNNEKSMSSETSFKKQAIESYRFDSNKVSPITEARQEALPDLQDIEMDEVIEQEFSLEEENKRLSKVNTESYSHFLSSTTATVKSDGDVLNPTYCHSAFHSLPRYSPPKQTDKTFQGFPLSSLPLKPSKGSLNSTGEHLLNSNGQILIHANKDFFTNKESLNSVGTVSTANYDTLGVPKLSLYQNNNANIFSSKLPQDFMPMFSSSTLKYAEGSDPWLKENVKKDKVKKSDKETEAERQRIEGIRILEIEKQKRIIEEQIKIKEKMIIEKLKKDLSIRMKAFYARKYGIKYFNIWKEKVRLLKQSRDFPMLVPLSVDGHLKEWGSMKSVPNYSILKRASEKNSCYKVMLRLLWSGITDPYNYIAAEVAENLAKTTSDKVSISVLRSIFWKLAVSIPWVGKAPNEFALFSKLIRRWCVKSFYKDGQCSGSVETIITSLKLPVNISVHLFDDMPLKDDIQGVDAVIFIVLDQAEPAKECLKRLHSLVSEPRNSKPVSLAVMNLSGNNITVALESELQKLQDESAICHWYVNRWENHESIMQSLRFLTDNFSVSPHICASSLHVLLKEVCEELFDSLSCGQHFHNGLRKALKNPNTVIQIYNSCLIKLENLLTSRQLAKYFNFAHEFKMHVPMNESGGLELLCDKQHDDEYLHFIKKKINSLKLPELSKWPVKSTNRLLKTLKDFCMQVHDITVFPQIIRMIDLPDHFDINNHLEQCSWLNIVEIWAHCCFRHTFLEEKKRKRIFVVFNRNEVNKLISTQWWLNLPQIAQLVNEN